MGRDSQPIHKGLYERLKRDRLSHGLTHKEYAARIGLGYEVYKRIAVRKSKNKTIAISIDTANTISKYFGDLNNNKIYDLSAPEYTPSETTEYPALSLTGGAEISQEQVELDPAITADFFQAKADALRRKGHYESALITWLDAAHACEDAGTDACTRDAINRWATRQCRYYLFAMSNARHCGRDDLFEDAANAFYKHFPRLKDPPIDMLVTFLTQVSAICVDRETPENGLFGLSPAYALCNNSDLWDYNGGGPSISRAFNLRWQGHTKHQTDVLDRAVDEFDGDEEGLAAAAYSRMCIACEREDYKGAMDLYEASSHVLHKGTPWNEAIVLNTLAACQHELKNEDEAFKTYRKSYRLHVDNNFRAWTAVRSLDKKKADIYSPDVMLGYGKRLRRFKRCRISQDKMVQYASLSDRYLQLTKPN